MTPTISSPPPPSEQNLKNRTIFTRDCLEVMRGMKDECIDLIYLDPPFNSNANYAAPIGSEAAGAEFKDTWGLSDIDVAWYGEIAEKHPGLYELLTATRTIHGDSMMSYLIYIAIRMMEMKRILKNTGSIYLHCDPTAGHYLKLMLDTVFGKANFRNEVVWWYRRWPAKHKNFQRMHDTIFRYSNTDEWIWNQLFDDLSESSQKMWKGKARVDVTNVEGRRHSVTGERESKGVPMRDVWEISVVHPAAKQSTGYPTQKPLALLQRIIKASSNEGDMVLDPFCGCATACIAAEIEGRQWIGIDVSPKAYDLVKSRLKREVNIGEGEMFGDVIHRTDIPSDRKGKKSKNIRHIRYGEQEGRCNGCMEHFPFKNMTEDHIVPKARGGADADDNIQLLCNWCNSKKGHRMTHDELVAILIEEGVRK